MPGRPSCARGTRWASRCARSTGWWPTRRSWSQRGGWPRGRSLEERIAEAEGRAAFLSERNDKLAGTLREAREQLITLKEEIDRLGQPPSGYGVFLEQHEDGTVDIFTGGRKLRVSVSPNVE